MGAMENWGAIFFRDSRLLVDEARTSTATLRDVANVITHEIVHQWFGNLVTMQWWDDLWLNEAFATWLAMKIVDQWRPEWNSWTEFQQEKQVPLAIDALNATRPIRADVTHAAEIEEMFDALTYEKGAACLRMIEQFLGESAFREGIRSYIKAHAFQNAEAAALWSALSDASGKPVSEMARDWFARPGFPIVSLRAEQSNCANLVLEQKRFHAIASTISDGTTDPWTVPFVLRYKDARGVQEHPVLLTEATTSVALPAEGRVEWVFGNSKEAGFLRTHHDPALGKNLSIRDELLPEEKIGLLNHLWAEALRGDASIHAFMSALLAFRGDPCRVVVQEAAAYLEVLSNQLVLPKDRPRFAGWVQDWFAPLWKNLGWNGVTGEDDERRLSRASALWALGALAQDEEILSELPRQQTRYWAKPEVLDPTLATPLIRLCARTDGGSLFEPYLKKFQTGETPEERDRYLVGLTDFQKPDLARKVLALTLSDTVRTQDAWKPVRYLLANPATQEVAWNFVQRNWEALKQKGGSVGAQRIIQGTKHLWRLEWRDEVDHLFNDPAHRVDAARRTLSQTLEFIDVGLWFRASQQAKLSAYLNANG
jgi:puromycin-sensitive aminopeptidase